MTAPTGRGLVVRGPLLMTRACPGDIPVVAGLWDEASTWLAGRGSDQWQYPADRTRIASAIAAGSCWLGSFAGQGPVATITLSPEADPQLWTPGDSPEAALYISRLVVTRAVAGAGLGSALLDWAGHRAMLDRRPWLRLNAWTRNSELRGWYALHGFDLVRVVPGRLAGACYQRPAAYRGHDGPLVRTLGVH